MTLREKELARQLEECQEALAQSHRENELLRQKIDLLVRRVFGSEQRAIGSGATGTAPCNCQSLRTSTQLSTRCPTNQEFSVIRSRKRTRATSAREPAGG